MTNQHAIRKNLLVLAVGLLITVSDARANTPEDSAALGELSIEQLLNLQVNTLSRKNQRLLEAAAAVTVVTQEDIRRSGATSIPEALRLVPGVDVAQINQSTWAVGIRGFNALFSNKLLVLIDGRSVYTPLFSGVFWDEIDMPLEDIERIEVVRGPGGTLWGANAVNGIINIITKNSHDTQGGMVSTGGGTEEKYFGTFRYGGAISEDTTYRVFGKYNNRDNFETFSGGEANDAWQDAHTGFRVDSTPTKSDRLMFQANSYYGQQGTTIANPTLTPPFTEDLVGDRYSSGANVIGRWEREIDTDSNVQAQLYYDRIDRDDMVLDHQRDTIDLDLQHRFSPLENNEVVYGIEYRFYRDDIRDTASVAFDPDSRNFDLFTWFAQDEISLLDRQLRLIFGSKFEHNEYTGFEFQPNARALWTPTEQSSVWVAVSRAVKTPSRASDDLQLTYGAMPTELGIPAEVVIFGSDDVESEELIAYEAGYRAQVTSDVSFDLAAYYNDYDDNESFEPGEPFPVLSASPHLVVPFMYENLLGGYTYGGEASVEWRAREDWRLIAYYAYLNMQLGEKPGGADPFSEATEKQSPRNQFMIRSLLNLPGDLEFDGALRYVDNIPNFEIESYFELDLRLAWKAAKNLEISVVGQNLLDNSHEEFVANFVNLEKVAVERGVYGKVVWSF